MVKTVSMCRTSLLRRRAVANGDRPSSRNCLPAFVHATSEHVGPPQDLLRIPCGSSLLRLNNECDVALARGRPLAAVRRRSASRRARSPIPALTTRMTHLPLFSSAICATWTFHSAKSVTIASSALTLTCVRRATTSSQGKEQIPAGDILPPIPCEWCVVNGLLLIHS